MLIKNYNCIGLIDTGANLSVLGNNMHKRFLKNKSVLHKTYISARTADNSPLNVIGTLTLPVTCNKLTKTVDFLIIPNISTDVILGMDFIYNFKLLKSFIKSDDIITFKSEPEHKNSIEEIKAVIPRDELSSSQTKHLEKVIEEFKEISTDRVGLGKTHLVEHKIVTTGPPIKQRYYPLSPPKLNALNEEVDRMLELGVIAPSRSPWSNPVVMAAKKDGSLRFCLDARKLNDVTVKDSYPIPYISSILDNLKGAKYLTALDLSSSFWQINLSNSDDVDGNGTSCQKTAFVVPNRGLYEFRRMPFGLSNAGSEMQRLVDKLFGHQFGDRVFPYIDDLLVCTETFDEHIAI